MIQSGRKLFLSSEFAKKSGVTKRTLRHYDEINLLKPQLRNESNYRFYSEDDFGKLQNIQTLKFIGFSLDDIKKFIENTNINLGSSLKLQRIAIEEKIKHLQQVAFAILEAEESIKNEPELNWDKIINIIKAVRMEKNLTEWKKQFFSKEQQNFIGGRLKDIPKEKLDENQKKWNILIGKVKKAVDKDPACDEVQELAKQWLDLINEFSGGDVDLEKSLFKLYEKIEEMPEEIRPYNREVQDFINKAMQIYKSLH